MKNFLISSFSSFIVLFLFSFASPVLLGGGDALAQTCSGTPATCASQDTETKCDLITGCSWSVGANETKFTETICNIFNIATGNGGKAFAAFAIISIGIGFFTGKVSWGLMIAVAAGIAAMFGAPSIVSAISGEESFDCKT